VELADTPLPALADPGRIEQVIYNLIENALKYSPADGSVRIDSEVAGRDAVLRVSNSGPELTPSQQARVFDLFYRVEGTRGRGRGIGLYIVKMLVEAQGGRVTVESGKGLGTTFSVYLPLAEA
jgi:signal transduction histidine kinase